jgi:predicted RNA-binding protein YlxR (DUF448 family)
VRARHVPLRRCVVCGERRSKPELLRIARRPDGEIEIDADPKTPGRGAYVCRTPECIAESADGSQICRTLKHALSKEAAAELAALAERLAAASHEGR